MRRLILALLLVLGLSGTAAAQDGPPPEVRRTLDRVMAMLRGTDDAALTGFGDVLAEPYRRSFAGDALARHLRALRDAARGHTQGVGVEATGERQLVLLLDENNGGPRIRVNLDDRAHITLLELAATAGASAPGPSGPVNPPAPASSGPPATREAARPYHVRALTRLGNVDADSGLAMLERLHFSPTYLRGTSRADRLELIRRLRVAAAGAGSILVNEDDAGIHIALSGDEGPGTEVLFTIEPAAPFRILTMSLQPLARQARPAAAPAIGWDQIASRIREAEAAGLSGQILVRRQGREVLRTSFGLADRATGRRSAPDDIYGTGSTPIDFTVTAARILAQRGALNLDEPIGRYLPGVPADKAPITARMLIEGRSGLPNFHHTESDADPDLTYIDRATAVRRILGMPLLFAPGSQRQPSHSAFGLLAAIIESVSGQTYQAFVRREIFQPLGMTRTGFNGENLGLADAAFATGYGRRSAATPNIPPKWGPTSWLVMGSGGMFSTLDDLRRYYDGMASGALFDHRPARRADMSVNGSDNGYYFTHLDNGRGDEILLISNTLDVPGLNPLSDGLAALIMGGR